MKHLPITLLVVGILMACASTAFAQEAGVTMEGVNTAIQNGHWFIAIGGALFLLVGMVKKFAWTPDSRWGKYLLSGILAGGGVLGLALYGGAGFSLGLVGSVLVAAATAAWGHQLKKDLKKDQ